MGRKIWEGLENKIYDHIVYKINNNHQKIKNELNRLKTGVWCIAMLII